MYILNIITCDRVPRYMIRYSVFILIQPTYYYDLYVMIYEKWLSTIHFNFNIFILYNIKYIFFWVSICVRIVGWGFGGMLSQQLFYIDSVPIYYVTFTPNLYFFLKITFLFTRLLVTMYYNIYSDRIQGWISDPREE